MINCTYILNEIKLEFRKITRNIKKIFLKYINDTEKYLQYTVNYIKCLITCLRFIFNFLIQM